MTRQNVIRAASKFLRTVYDGSLFVTADVLDAESKLLYKRDAEAAQVLIDNLENVKKYIDDYLIKNLRDDKDTI